MEDHGRQWDRNVTFGIHDLFTLKGHRRWYQKSFIKSLFLSLPQYLFKQILQCALLKTTFKEICRKIMKKARGEPSVPTDVVNKGWMISQMKRYLTNLYCTPLNKSCDMWHFPTGLRISHYLHRRALWWLSPIRDLHLNSGDALTTSCPSCHQEHECCQALTAASGSSRLTYVRTTVSVFTEAD